MQTSNKIIVSFLTFAWLSIIASLLISSRFATNKLYKMAGEVTKETTELQDFSVIHIMEASNLRVFSGDTNLLEYDEVSGGDIKPPKTPAIQDYSVKNDTLFIKNLRNASNGGYTLRVSNLKHLIVKNTGDVELLGFSQDSLLITAEETNKLMVNNSSLSYMHFLSPQKFDLEIKSSKDLNLTLIGDKNHCSVRGNIQSVTGKIGNYTKLYVPRKTEILDIDTSDNGELNYSKTIYIDQEDQ